MGLKVLLSPTPPKPDCSWLVEWDIEHGSPELFVLLVTVLDPMVIVVAILVITPLSGASGLAIKDSVSDFLWRRPVKNIPRFNSKL